MKRISLFGIAACFALGLVACGDDGNSTNVADEVSSSSESITLESSSSDEITSGSASGNTTKIAYTLKPFKGPLPNPHKGFTLLTEGAWNFVPEFRYGPDKNGAWDLITYGSGYQRWDN